MENSPNKILLPKKNLPYDPDIPNLRICPKNLRPYSTDVFSGMITDALFTICRGWKQVNNSLNE